MKYGFVTETRVVVHCSNCGEPATYIDGETMSFLSVEHAKTMLAEMLAGWAIVGYVVRCPECEAARICTELGHDLIEDEHWQIEDTPAPRFCRRCGELEPIEGDQL